MIFVPIVLGGLIISNYELYKGKHLTIEDRLVIEYRVDQNYTLREIAKRLRKDPTTISKEIKRNRFFKIKNKTVLRSCQHRTNCTKTNLCNDTCDKLCKKCSFINCYRACNEYSTKKCSRLNRYPYVCNGCSTSTACTYEKSYYKAKVADIKYKELLTSSRESLNITQKI